MSELAAVRDFAIIGAIIAAILVIGVLAWAAERRRRQRLSEALRGAGLDCALEPDPARKSASFERIGPFRDLRDGAAGVLWCADGAIDGQAVAVVEHKYTTGSGKNRRTYYHTVAACAREASTGWPGLRMVDENLFHKIADVFGSKDLQVESPEFNARWRVAADHAEFAMLVLSPEVQAWSLTLPRGTEIRIGRGGVALALSKQVDAPALLALARSAVALAGMIPAELDVWGGADRTSQ